MASGLRICTPTSVSHSGTSATINANGGVDVSAVTSVSLNGVFSSTYTNYHLIFSGDQATGVNMRVRMRSAGTDATASSWSRQYAAFTGGTATIARTTAMTHGTGFIYSYPFGGGFVDIYQPYLATYTMFGSSIIAEDTNDGYMVWNAVQYPVATSYDGLTIDVATGSITGNFAIYGYAE